MKSGVFAAVAGTSAHFESVANERETKGMNIIQYIVALAIGDYVQESDSSNWRLCTRKRLSYTESVIQQDAPIVGLATPQRNA